jgi:hypothetical protein
VHGILGLGPVSQHHRRQTVATIEMLVRQPMEGQLTLDMGGIDRGRASRPLSGGTLVLIAQNVDDPHHDY